MNPPASISVGFTDQLLPICALYIISLSHYSHFYVAIDLSSECSECINITHIKSFPQSLFLQDIKVVSMNTSNNSITHHEQVSFTFTPQFPSFTACLGGKKDFPEEKPHCRVVQDLFKLHSQRERKTQKVTLQL